VREAALTALLLLACHEAALEPEGHVVVHLDTDAPLPKSGLVTDPFEPPPLLDTVRIEIVTPDGHLACPSCRRELSLDADRVEAGATFTILPGSTAARDARIHAVAFRAEYAQAAGPLAVVEVWGRLPEVAREGARDVTLPLRIEDVGRPRGSASEPVDLDDGPPPRPRAITPLAARRSCSAPQPHGSVCVPSGAFWMGSPADTSIPVLLAPRLVAISPYYLDAHEVTVAAFRASGILGGIRPHSGSLTGRVFEDFCTFTEEPGPWDDYPVNCLPFSAARSYCRARGGDLPTEMQREYAGSALVGLPFVWGRDRPRCGDAVLARGPRSELFSSEGAVFKRTCLPDSEGDPVLELLGFPRPVHRSSKGRDVLPLPSGTIQDLVGSMAEWVKDGWQRRDEPCWASPTLFIDPVCEGGPLRVLRGAGWTTSEEGVPMSWREAHTANPESSGISIGFRCAYPGD
jgi:formylglycine-generating enzyme